MIWHIFKEYSLIDNWFKTNKFWIESRYLITNIGTASYALQHLFDVISHRNSSCLNHLCTSFYIWEIIVNEDRSIRIVSLCLASALKTEYSPD